MNTDHHPQSVVFVTGGASGIGAALVEAYVAAGSRVAFTYWSSEAAAADMQTRFGQRVLALAADVSDEAQVERAFGAATDSFGAPGIVVANAGGLLERVTCKDMTLAFWNQAIALNLTSAFLTCRAAISAMLPTGRGSIVIMASLAGHDGGGPGASHYAAAKGALISYTRALAKEVGPQGIRVNAIAPGLIATRFHDRFNTPEGRAGAVARTPLRREGQPADVAAAALYLSSDSASFITGECIEVNGGMALY